MGAVLPPPVSESETDEQAASYDRWFRAKVQESINDPRQALPHDEVMARMDEIIAAVESRQDRGKKS
ncbi:hypothetical protein ACILG0_17415 [Pseudomonadota bacterium AL_CKDN230030165-1A_HGKHYDSX7]